MSLGYRPPPQCIARPPSPLSLRERQNQRNLVPSGGFFSSRVASPGRSELGALPPPFRRCSQPLPADSLLSSTAEAATPPLSLPTTSHPSPEPLRGTRSAAQQGLNQLGMRRRSTGRVVALSLLPQAKQYLLARVLRSAPPILLFFFPFPADSHQPKGTSSWCQARRWLPTSHPSQPNPAVQPGHHSPPSQDPSQEKAQLGHCCPLRNSCQVSCVVQPQPPSPTSRFLGMLVVPRTGCFRDGASEGRKGLPAVLVAALSLGHSFQA